MSKNRPSGFLTIFRLFFTLMVSFLFIILISCNTNQGGKKGLASEGKTSSEETVEEGVDEGVLDAPPAVISAVNPSIPSAIKLPISTSSSSPLK